jgi:metal-responsive CopG/Arc/MetJ family transcriptional regulator
LLREIRVSVPVGLVDRLDWENGSREERDAMVADALQEYFDDWDRQNAEAGIK